MYCQKCGTQNPDEAQFCNSCGAILTPATATTERPLTKTSGLAIASFVLGLLSLFTLGITAIPAIILGIISLVRIGRSGGRLTGTAFAVVGIVVPAVSFFLMMGIMLPALARVRQLAFRMTCGTNLSAIGKAIHFYVNDYEDELPRAGGPTTSWGYTPNWQADDRFTAFGVQPDRTGGQASISASLYFLVRYEQLTPKSFLCKGDINTTEFIPAKYGVHEKDLIDLWDFGPEPWKHCSYAYHIPYSQYALTSSSLPGMAVAADRSPWIDSPSAEAKDWILFRPDTRQFGGAAEHGRYGNAVAHQEDGQNVLFIDGHVEFAKRPYCGVEDDNIYTHLPQGLGHPQIGEPPLPFLSQPGHRKDSFLVHDPPILDKR